MGEAAQAGGKGPSVEFEGVRYELAPFDIDMIQMFELWLEERAWNAVERLRHKISEQQYEKRLDIVGRQVASLQYSYGSQAYAAAATSVEGQKFITFLMLAKKNRGMDQELAGRIWEHNIALLRAKMASMQADPNGESPAIQKEAGEETTTSTPSPKSTLS